MTEEQELESLKFSLESCKLRHTEKDMEISRLKKEIDDQDKIIKGYAQFIRDNLQNVRSKKNEQQT
tara:strand:+ start:226 stop:423 length:198 start_codon:yes stop_codon:yes gene_type:complete